MKNEILLKNILNDKAIPILVEKVNKHIQEQSESNQIIIENAKKELYNVDKQINNIVSAIAQGFAYDEFKTKMEALKDRKTKLESTLMEQEIKRQAPQITEEQVKNLFSIFRGFVRERNIPECKKFIQNYVDKVIVYKDHVEVNLDFRGFFIF